MIDPEHGSRCRHVDSDQAEPGADSGCCRGQAAGTLSVSAYPYPRSDLAGHAGAAAGRRADGNHDSEHPAVPDHRRGRLRHPGDFFMIVVEKTRDIGILKSLGASSRGVMSIFLGYGLSLGVVGSGVGVVLGLLFVWNINEIASVIELDHRPRGLRSDDLLLSRNSHHHQSVHGDLDRLRSHEHRRGASVLPALRAARASGGGTSL